MKPSSAADSEESFPEIGVDDEPREEGAAQDGSSSLETLTPEKLNEICAALRKLPPLEPSQRLLDRRGAVGRLRKPILTAQRRGYTLAQIADMLTSEGLDIKASTLRVYLRQVRRRRRHRAEDARRANMPLVLRG